MSLAGKRAVITGSNSGIGLGVAEALAAAGAEVVLNSFTDRPEDHALARRSWGPARGDRALHRRRHVEGGRVPGADRKGGRLRHPGEQCGYPVRLADRGVSRSRSGMRFWRSTCRRPSTPSPPPCRGCGPRAGAGSSTSPSAHGLTASPYKSAYVAAKHGGRRADQDRGAGNGGAGDHLQRDLPGLCADPLGRGADPRPDEGAQHGPRNGDPRGDAAAPAQPPVRDGGTGGRDDGVLCAARRRTRSPARRSRSMAGGRRCDAARQPCAARGRRAWGLYLGRAGPAAGGGRP